MNRLLFNLYFIERNILIHITGMILIRGMKDEYSALKV